MGIYDPSKDESNNQDVKINSVSTVDGWQDEFQDGVQKTLSLTNDLAVNTLGRLRGLSDGLSMVLGGGIDGLNGIRGFGDLLPKVVYNSNEIVTKGVPPAEVYQKCQQVEGLALWDQYGLWHCLFPRSRIQGPYSDDLVSREDIEKDVDNKHGLFFKNMEDMLGWQAGMKQAIAEKKRRQWLQWQNNEKAKWSFNNEDDNNEKNAGNIIGRESETQIRTLDNGDIEKLILKRSIYADGTTKEWQQKEVVGADGVVKSKSNSDDQ